MPPMRSILYTSFLALLLFMVAMGCTEKSAPPTQSQIAAGPIFLNERQLQEGVWKQLTQASDEFSTLHFLKSEMSPDRLVVAATTGSGYAIDGVFYFTDKGGELIERPGIFEIDNGLIKEEVTLKLSPDGKFLYIVDSEGKEQKLRQDLDVSRSR